MNLNGRVIHPLLTCYFENLPRMLNGGSVPLPFRRKPVFVNKLLIYTLSVGIM